ncbi:putative membrane-anchored protein [Elusimicrobium posterum]|uniref:GDYXXLXY domain-containing protein n=1 Tax=Elusimicrobium posterum TaxID=3116653 RepID=UPI003C767595
MRVKLFLIFTVLILCIFGGLIVQKELVLKNGKTFYLELRPVDPRSILQGDYMELRYNIRENTINPHKEEAVCIVLDQDGVGRYLIESIKEKCIAQGDVWVKVKKQSHSYRLAPDSFFFQEGHAHLYENASYAVLKYDGKGAVVLSGLADNKLQEIKP